MTGIGAARTRTLAQLERGMNLSFWSQDSFNDWLYTSISVSICIYICVCVDEYIYFGEGWKVRLFVDRLSISPTPISFPLSLTAKVGLLENVKEDEALNTILDREDIKVASLVSAIVVRVNKRI